ncbi:hypothetical protein QEZ54_26195 [Catellatospora sp. KI3]|uniref:hypothetical protein n=1 Tax=Catellatospora sp. KI3 TaxID=3041620 RepID=UPI0024826824|nr:hypothetical protein [Catellatospora sp. KI3]MDI1464469.1 hypothetical protein [Catellatospora sp. KI3]
MNGTARVGLGMFGVSMIILLLTAPLIDNRQILAISFAAEFVILGVVFLHAGLTRGSPRRDENAERCVTGPTE